MEATHLQINLKVKNNTALPQPVSILGIVPNSNTANNNNLLYEFNLTGQSFVGVTTVNINIANTSNPTVVVNTAPVLTQSIQGVVYALNTLNQGLFSYSGSTIYVSSNYYIYSNISIAGSSTLGTTLPSPYGIAIDSLGNVYTANINAITKITQAGVSSTFYTFLAGQDCYDLTIDSFDVIYASCQTANVVVKINTITGSSSIYGTTQNQPRGIIKDSVGNVFVANYGSNSVTKITPLNVSTVLGVTSGFPSDVAIDSAGNIYTANNNTNNVNKITPLGVVTIFATTGSSPDGITIDSMGNLYVNNYGSNNVSKITPLGVSAILGTTGGLPASIVLDSFNNVYTANRGSDNVTKITPTGISTTLSITGTQPLGITIDPYGNLYTSNNGSDNVTIIVQ
jgi:streptogramin lyase